MIKLGKILFVAFLVFKVFMFAGWLFFKISSPGVLPPLKDEAGVEIEGSVSHKHWLEIGGIDQGFFIRGESADNPVILFLHGGPGSPELPFIMAGEKGDKFDKLEKYFTVCYWDQRGAGMTFSPSLDHATATVEQMVEDTRQMTEYLMERFGQDKIILMGHSWGSFLGVKTIERYPRFFSAYIGVGQVTDQTLSEKLAYDYMLGYAEEIGDKGAARRLRKFDRAAADFPQMEYVAGIRTGLMNKYGVGVKHRGASMSGIVGEIMLFPGYTFAEKVRYARGSLFSLEHIFHNVLRESLFETTRTFEVPVYIIHGQYDYQVSCTLAQKYLETIEAPAKEFFLFENSAHSPNLEERERFIEVVRDIALRHSNQ